LLMGRKLLITNGYLNQARLPPAADLFLTGKRQTEILKNPCSFFKTRN
jgi:hypothetical protein